MRLSGEKEGHGNLKRGIKFEDRVTVDMEVTKSTHDFARWSIRHQFYKEDGTLSTILNMDGAWIHVSNRKLTTPDSYVRKIFDDFPKSSDFQWDDRSSKKT